MSRSLKLPTIPDSEKTPLVLSLLDLIQNQSDKIKSLSEKNQLHSEKIQNQSDKIKNQSDKIQSLSEKNQLQSEKIKSLKDSISELKGLKKRPKIKPSGMEKKTNNNSESSKDSSSKDSSSKGSSKDSSSKDSSSKGSSKDSSSKDSSSKDSSKDSSSKDSSSKDSSKDSSSKDSSSKDSSKDSSSKGSSRRPGSKKRSKTDSMKTHETKTIPPTTLPKGSVFKGYKTFVVQGLRIEPHHIKYQLERWQTPDGSYVCGEVPSEAKGHFSSQLVSFILYQYHHGHVTQPRLSAQLFDYGVDISAGQIDNVLTKGNEIFHQEKEDILSTGLEISSYIQVDDTSARHQGRNGYCTHIGNDFFASFSSTQSKSRINFLNLLSCSKQAYHLTEDSFSYMETHKLSKSILHQFRSFEGLKFKKFSDWEKFLNEQQIKSSTQRRILTEGALFGGLLSNGFNPNLVILSDDAGQFNIGLHQALCWVHSERHVYKLVGFEFDEKNKDGLEDVRHQIWGLYNNLKKYKQAPSDLFKKELDQRFEEIFQMKTSFETLNQTLKRQYKNKEKLLLVLDRPEIPLHNNASESDIREYAKRRKVNGSTRSDLGRQGRDTFTSLKKTCGKLNVSFWEYLNDRTKKENKIPQLPELMRKKAKSQLSSP